MLRTSHTLMSGSLDEDISRCGATPNVALRGFAVASVAEAEAVLASLAHNTCCVVPQPVLKVSGAFRLRASRTDTILQAHSCLRVGWERKRSGIVALV